MRVFVSRHVLTLGRARVRAKRSTTRQAAMNGSPARWKVSSGEEVFVGDHVALARHPDSVGRIVAAGDAEDSMEVLLTSGPETGRVITVRPGDILLRLRR
ncbi:hypothetical protein CS0771_61600 [Catellatospora sp. IY07-71]|nr:hypothetical protein CS0771_61600 [Catellatospora sp. IY07-71]